MRILVDMDDTIADFNRGFLKLWRQTYPDHPWFPIEDQRTFYISEYYPPEFRDAVYDIFTTPGFIRGLDVIEGSKDALNEMIVMGFDVFICTTPLSQYQNCVLEKYQWLDENFGFEWTQRIILTHDKTLVKADILIDDKPNITGVENPPLWKQYFYAQPYNNGTLTWKNWKSVLGLE